MLYAEDRFSEECAVVGVTGQSEAAKYCYLGLYAMQHRGQEGAGIVSSDGEVFDIQRDTGLVSEVFDEKSLACLRGKSAIGHARYATCGSKNWQNLQPLVANLGTTSIALAHNGNIVNAGEVRVELEDKGAIFSTTSDTEVILHLIAHAGRNGGTTVEKLSRVLCNLKGAYSLVVLGLDSLIAVRDPHGVRPLSLGKMNDAYIVASETCAFDLVGAEFVRDIEPGEILEITEKGELKSTFFSKPDKAFCVFEYIYFSRPDSVIDGRNVYAVRKRLGAGLAKEHPVEADLVIPVPDSGVPAAIGYAQEVGLPLEFGLIRNHYVGRTFIEPKQSIRNFGVKIKLNANRDLLSGKRIIVVDDSIVRGTTSKKIVTMLRAAGASEVHMRICSPPTTGPCYYGIDTPSKDELIASKYSAKEVAQYTGADSLAYLSISGMYKAVGGEPASFCDACFSGNYRLGNISSYKGVKKNVKSGNSVNISGNSRKKASLE